MDTTEAISVSEILESQSNNGNGHVHTLKPRDDRYQAAYEAGLASGREAGYRRGYREGFSDCFKLCSTARGTAGTQELSKNLPKRVASIGEKRLRGLPCANCGAASYVDEAQCPSCRTPKAKTTDQQHIAANEAQSGSLRTRRNRRRS